MLLALAGATCSGQATPVQGATSGTESSPTLQEVVSGVWRLEGKDIWSGLRYVRLLTFDTRIPSGQAPDGPDLDQPTLTGQCTQDNGGRYHFELFVNFGNVADAAFYPPWHSTGPDDLFQPSTAKVMLTMEFLGYTKVKPFKRQFEQTVAPGPAQLRYVNPGLGSTNMEPPGWFFQYLRALPTLRASGPGQTASFATANWLARLHAEPLCAGSGA